MHWSQATDEDKESAVTRHDPTLGFPRGDDFANHVNFNLSSLLILPINASDTICYFVGEPRLFSIHHAFHISLFLRGFSSKFRGDKGAINSL